MPRAHDVLPAAFTVVRISAGELPLVRRIDDATGRYPEESVREAGAKCPACCSGR